MLVLATWWVFQSAAVLPLEEFTQSPLNVTVLLSVLAIAAYCVFYSWITLVKADNWAAKVSILLNIPRRCGSRLQDELAQLTPF